MASTCSFSRCLLCKLPNHCAAKCVTWKDIDISIFLDETVWQVLSQFDFLEETPDWKLLYYLQKSQSIPLSWFQMSFAIRNLNWYVRLCCEVPLRLCFYIFPMLDHLVSFVSMFCAVSASLLWPDYYTCVGNSYTTGFLFFFVQFVHYSHLCLRSNVA